MEVTFDQVGEIGVAEVPVEELDASNAPEFKRDIAAVVKSNAKLVLDMGRLRFVDSSGLGAIFSCLRQLREKGGDMKICCMSKQVLAAFELVRLHRIFDIYSSREEAVRAFES